MARTEETSPRHEVENLLDSGFSESGPSLSHATLVARNILSDLMQFRRFAGSQSDCAEASCAQCASPHLAKIVAAVRQRQRVTFVLPGFPGKSPNPAKVLGPLPDMAERYSLEFLQHLCDRIKQHHAPGAQIILCSDGRVFSDAVGMRDEDVTAYQDEISRIISSLDLSSISRFDLEERYHGMSFDEMRTRMMEQYGDSLEDLKASVRRGKEVDCSREDQESHRLYCGITRFLVEDAMIPGQTKSRTALQKECRTRAYTVIQRSKAWGKLLDDEFPDAVRLSIHPQSCGAKKLGIRLIEPDQWQTPWHAVAVHGDGRFILLKRWQAEALGARLVTRFGRPSHYLLTSTEGLAKLLGDQDEA